MRLWPNARCMYIIGVRPSLVSNTTTKTPTPHPEEEGNTPLEPGHRTYYLGWTTEATWVWLANNVN